MPRTNLGKGCAKIRYTEINAVDVIRGIIKEIILYVGIKEKRIYPI